MKPRGSLAATVLTEGKTLLKESALHILHQAKRRGILPSGREVIFQKYKKFGKKETFQ